MVSSVALGDSAFISVASFDLRGPRLIPGRPRPNPFPEVVTVPSGRTYVRGNFLLEDPGVRGGNACTALGMMAIGAARVLGPASTVGLNCKVDVKLLMAIGAARVFGPASTVGLNCKVDVKLLMAGGVGERDTVMDCAPLVT
jgi:hypothetical protein